MPIISIFYGLIIRMYHADHSPPHFHVQYGEKDIIVEISSGKILKGNISPRLKRLIEEWRKLYKSELQKAWDDIQNLKQPKRIKPLE